MSTSIRSPDGRHGVIVVYPFGRFREAEFVEDWAVIDRLVNEGNGWRITAAVRVTHESE